MRKRLHGEVLFPTARSEVTATPTLHGFCSLERSRIGAKNGSAHSHFLEAASAHLHGVARNEKERGERGERERGDRPWPSPLLSSSAEMGWREDRMANVTIQGRKKHVVSETFHLTNAIQLILRFRESFLNCFMLVNWLLLFGKTSATSV